MDSSVIQASFQFERLNGTIFEARTSQFEIQKFFEKIFSWIFLAPQTLKLTKAPFRSDSIRIPIKMKIRRYRLDTVQKDSFYADHLGKFPMETPLNLRLKIAHRLGTLKGRFFTEITHWVPSLEPEKLKCSKRAIQPESFQNNILIINHLTRKEAHFNGAHHFAITQDCPGKLSMVHLQSSKSIYF